MKNKQRIINLTASFIQPLIIFFGMILYLVLAYFHNTSIAIPFVIGIIIFGSYDLFLDTAISLRKGQFALDYIAILAIIVSLITQEYFVAALIALMISSGRTLEEYGVAQAKKTLTGLIDRIPNEITLWEKDQPGKKEKIESVKINDEIYIRKGEVIALDGILVSKRGETDESSLTGEPYFLEKISGDQMRSGTINVGDAIVVRVIKTQENSTYNKIIEMVKKAQGEKAPLLRLADKYSTVFTLITLIIVSFAWFYSHSLTQVLAVLVIATPCPLIIATPIALLGGVNASAKKRIIVKKLASLEALSRTTSFIFDKTGTITLGKPRLSEINVLTKELATKKILGIAQAIERSSLHPLAKAIVLYAKENGAPTISVTDIEEKIGEGISGVFEKKRYLLSKEKQSSGMTIVLSQNSEELAKFRFEDEIKEDSKSIIKKIKNMGIDVYIFTGDKKEAAEKIIESLGTQVSMKAECSPQDKQEGILALKKQGKVTAMVGDGINDAPALALADVGLVFSNEEQTAASEAADIVFLGNEFSLVLESLYISKRTISIALQSILWGIGISVGGMVFAAFGLIPPVVGAFLQEAIDVAVILNALRASRA